MKNYLFAPFKDDDDKIESFKHLKRYLPTGHRSELVMVVGRLESYYDRYITHLKVEDKKLNTESCNMKAEINTLIRSNNKRVDMIKELKSKLAISIKDEEIIQAQGEEIKRLKADIRHDAKVCDDYDDDLIKECQELQAENDRLNADNKRLYQEHKECRSKVVDTIG